jgi:hypothetical protein
MRQTALTKLIHHLENLILEAQLHERFNTKVIPLHVEQRIKIRNPDWIKYQ